MVDVVKISLLKPNKVWREVYNVSISNKSIEEVIVKYTYQHNRRYTQVRKF